MCSSRLPIYPMSDALTRLAASIYNVSARQPDTTAAPAHAGSHVRASDTCHGLNQPPLLFLSFPAGKNKPGLLISTTNPIFNRKGSVYNVFWASQYQGVFLDQRNTKGFNLKLKSIMDRALHTLLEISCQVTVRMILYIQPQERYCAN